MRKGLELFLGILTAMGGFVEIGELTFSVNAGVKFGYSLMWLMVLGSAGIIVFGEMSGRVAAVAHQPVFNLIRERVGFNAGLVTLLAASLEWLTAPRASARLVTLPGARRTAAYDVPPRAAKSAT